MRHSTTFRLDDKTISLLKDISKKTHKSKTSVVEAALLEYSIRKNPHYKLLKFAGCLRDENIDAILKEIEDSRVNKE